MRWTDSGIGASLKEKSRSESKEIPPVMKQTTIQLAEPDPFMDFLKNALTRTFSPFSLLLATLLVGLFPVQIAFGAAGDTLFTDDFDDGTLSPWTAYYVSPWTTDSDPDRAGVSSATSQSGAYSMYVRWGYAAGVSPEFDADVPAAELSVWIRRGDDAFSEDPDADEDLHIQYQNDSGNWQDLDILAGGGTPGEIFTPTYTLPSNARHGSLKIRFWLDQGSGEDYDYWHMDDVRVTERGLDSFCRSGAAIHDSFEDGTLDPWDAPPPGQSDGITGVSQATAAYGEYSAFVGEGSVYAESEKVQLQNVSSAELSVWIRRGDDAFSEDPDSGEDLVLEYRAQQGNNWNELQTYNGEGDPGEIFTPSFSLPEEAFHNNFRIRFRLTGGSGEGYDYWHFDNVCLTTVGGGQVDHYAVSHDESAVTCYREPITITAHNPGHQPVSAGTAKINISTNTTEGTWSKVLKGNGTLKDNTAGDGSATYQFPGEEEFVKLAFNYTNVTKSEDPETVNIDVEDGAGNTEDPNEDPDLQVSRTGLIFTNESDDNQTIPNQIAGKPSDTPPGDKTLAIQAVQASNEDPSVCEPAFPDGETRSVEFAAECRNPGTCSGSRDFIVTNDGSDTQVPPYDNDGKTGVPSDDSVYTEIDLLFSKNATAIVAYEFDDAGKMQLHARHEILYTNGTASGNYMLGSSNQFVFRPFGFHIDIPGNPGATSASDDPPFTTAGKDFNATLTAVVWESGDDANNDGIPDGHNDQNATNNTDLSDNQSTPNFGQESDSESVELSSYLWKPDNENAADPGLSGDTTISTFTDGSGNSTGVQFNEVGIIETNATISDNDYLGIGSSVTSKIVGSSGPVGRFIPNHFKEENASLTNRSHITSCYNNFTYLDEQWSMNFNIIAKNISNVKTQNYIDNFAKLPITNSTYNKNDANSTGLNFSAVHNPTNSSIYVPAKSLTDRMKISDISGTFTNGTAKVHLNGTIYRDSTIGPDGPFDDFWLGFKPIDDDNVRLTGNLDLNSTLSNGNDTYKLVDTNIRYGRLDLENAYGSELQNLEVPIKAQYYDGSNFDLHDNDWCTELTLGNSTDKVEMELKNEDPGWQSANQTIQLIPLESEENGGSTEGIALQNDGSNATSLRLDNGTASLILEAPGANNTGYVHVRSNLENHPWLRYDWNGDNSTESPNATATFGIYKGNEHVIYQQETTWK
ncbi:MAG: DUF6701 domain-containing protein [Desulfohalobiaceae bacterium]